MAADALAEIERVIVELRAHLATGTQELIHYKGDEKVLAGQAEALAAEALAWRQRAEQAVLAGDDALARQALSEERRVSELHTQVVRERREMGAYAHELLKKRRELQQRLALLEAKKGTMAVGIAQARSGTGAVLAAEGPAWDTLARVEDKIADEAVLAELDAELGEKAAGADDPELQRRLREAKAELALAELKQKMRS